MGKFMVVGIYTDTGEVFSDPVESSETAQDAIKEAEKVRWGTPIRILAVFEGHPFPVWIDDEADER